MQLVSCARGNAPGTDDAHCLTLLTHALRMVERHTVLLSVSCVTCTLQQCKMKRNLGVTKVGEKHSGRISENRGSVEVEREA